MESITYEVERSINERLKNIKSELGLAEIDNRLASTNIMLKKLNNDHTLVSDKGITVSHLLKLEEIAARVHKLETSSSLA